MLSMKCCTLLLHNIMKYKYTYQYDAHPTKPVLFYEERVIYTSNNAAMASKTSLVHSERVSLQVLCELGYIYVNDLFSVNTYNLYYQSTPFLHMFMQSLYRFIWNSCKYATTLCDLHGYIYTSSFFCYDKHKKIFLHPLFDEAT